MSGREEYNYATIEVPEDTDPKDYHYTERRAEILQLVMRAGGPRRVNQARLGERYGVTRQQIGLDMDRLGKHIAETIGDDADIQVESAFHKIYDELVAAEEWERAWRVVESYMKLLERHGHVTTEPAKLDVTTREAAEESESYRIVEENDDEHVVVMDEATLVHTADGGTDEDGEASE